MSAAEGKKERVGEWYLGTQGSLVSDNLMIRLKVADGNVNELVAEQFALEQMKKRGCSKDAKLFLVWVKKLEITD